MLAPLPNSYAYDHWTLEIDIVHRYFSDIQLTVFSIVSNNRFQEDIAGTSFGLTITKKKNNEISVIFHDIWTNVSTSDQYNITLTGILETVVTFHFSGSKVYSRNKGCHTCMIKHTMHVQSLHCSTYLTWLDVCIYVPRSHFHFLKRMLGKGQLRTA